MLNHVNELSILVSAILAVAVGSIWYSPLLFGPAWIRSIGKTMENSEVSAREMQKATVRAVVTQGVFFAILAQFLVYAVSEHFTLMHLGTLVTALIVVHSATMIIWEERPYTYVLINAGYVAVSVFGGLSIMSYWPW